MRFYGELWTVTQKVFLVNNLWIKEYYINCGHLKIRINPWNTVSWPTIVVWLLLFIIVFIDNKKTKHMLLKLWGLPCTPAVVHTSYFECVIKAAAWKVKVSNMFACWSNGVKYRKNYCELQFLWENESEVTLSKMHG